MDDRAAAPPVLFAAAVLAPLAVCAALSGLRDQVEPTNAALVLVLVVVSVAAGGSRVAGILAALSSTLWFDFFLTEPYLTFTIDRRDDIETAVLLAAVGVLVTEIALWGRRQQARSSKREGYLRGVVTAAGMAADGSAGTPVVLELIGRQIGDVLGADRCVYEAAPPVSRPRLERDGSVTRDGRPIDVDRSGLPTNDVVEVPVTHGGRTTGKYVVTATSRTTWPTLEQRLVAVTLADQAASALVGGSGPGAGAAVRPDEHR